MLPKVTLRRGVPRLPDPLTSFPHCEASPNAILEMKKIRHLILGAPIPSKAGCCLGLYFPDLQPKLAEVSAFQFGIHVQFPLTDIPGLVSCTRRNCANHCFSSSEGCVYY